jgi:hypothetical protein
MQGENVGRLVHAVTKLLMRAWMAALLGKILHRSNMLCDIDSEEPAGRESPAEDSALCMQVF